MRIKFKYVIVVVVLITIGVGYYLVTPKGPGKYDEFAQCLTERGAIFYGSYQCSHCNTQKELFGSSIRYVNYIECGPLSGPLNEECREAGITAYPTWIINDNKYVGVQDLSRLSELTDCSLS